MERKGPIWPCRALLAAIMLACLLSTAVLAEDAPVVKQIEIMPTLLFFQADSAGSGDTEAKAPLLRMAAAAASTPDPGIVSFTVALTANEEPMRLLYGADGTYRLVDGDYAPTATYLYGVYSIFNDSVAADAGDDDQGLRLFTGDLGVSMQIVDDGAFMGVALMAADDMVVQPGDTGEYALRYGQAQPFSGERTAAPSATVVFVIVPVLSGQDGEALYPLDGRGN